MAGRKMDVVPFKLWEEMKRWKEEHIQKHRLPPDPKVLTTASLHRDLSSVMANDDLSEAEKSQLFGQTMYKFKTAHKKALTKDPVVQDEKPDSKIDQRFMDSVSSTMQRKAKLLMSILRDNPNLSWDEDGTVKMYGKPVHGSNIIDLVNDVLRQRKGIEPTGWQPFAEGLRDMNVPQDVVRNKRRWEWMHSKTPDGFVTPKTKRHSLAFISTARKHTKRRAATSISTTRKLIKEELFSSRRQLDSPKWLSFDEQ